MLGAMWMNGEGGIMGVGHIQDSSLVCHLFCLFVFVPCLDMPLVTTLHSEEFCLFLVDQ